jgi:hypothetical protein
VDTFFVAFMLMWGSVIASLLVGIGVVLFMGSHLPFPEAHRPERAVLDLTLATAGSVIWVVQVGIVLAYVGMRLPWRVRTASTYPELRVRRSIAAIGAIAITLVTWLVPTALDPVRAIGYVLLPFVFALAALRGPAQPPTAWGWRLYLVVAAVYAMLVAGWLLLVVTQPRVDADYSRIGLPPSSAGIVGDDVEVSHLVPAAGDEPASSSVWVWADTEETGELPIDATSVEVEAWPAEVRNETLVVGEGPLVTRRINVDRRPSVRWWLPAPRDRELVVVTVVATLPDGRRVMLDAAPAVEATPMRHGSLASWWFGG